MGNISKECFMIYYDMQMSGKYNMIMDMNKVMEETGLSYDEYKDILVNYIYYQSIYL